MPWECRPVRLGTIACGVQCTILWCCGVPTSGALSIFLWTNTPLPDGATRVRLKSITPQIMLYDNKVEFIPDRKSDINVQSNLSRSGYHKYINCFVRAAGDHQKMIFTSSDRLLLSVCQ